MTRVLVDTDIIIDYLRDNKQAVIYIESISDLPQLSVITIAELNAGIRNTEEKNALEKFLQSFQIIPVSQDIAETGGQFRREYGKSHGTGLADALIAATALSQDAVLASLNKRHYPMIKNLLVPYKK